MAHLFTLHRLGFASLLLLGTVAAYSAPGKTSWLSTFSQSPQGAYIIGSPAAPAKVVEYMSYTCGHCANFESKEAPLLKSHYVSTGKASFEIRNFVLNPVDLTAAMLARCGGKARFFGNHKHLLATQKTWITNADKISAATDAKLRAADYQGYMTGVYIETGLSTIMQQRGITVAQGKACLADKAAFNFVVNMSDEGDGLGVKGTPTFMVNGRVDSDIHDFQTLKGKIPAN
ncbi:MAG: thioredoxin domain-containing protein [Sphingorhabdus sp.]